MYSDNSVEELNKEKTTYPVGQSEHAEWMVRPRERKNKKHGCPNTSIWNKTQSRAKRICKSGLCKFFWREYISQALKKRHMQEKGVWKSQLSKDFTFFGRDELSEVNFC